MELFRRLQYQPHWPQRNQELDAELQFHRETMASNDRRRFGNPLRLREAAHEAWGWGWLERWGQDGRYALRQLRRKLGFRAP